MLTADYFGKFHFDAQAKNFSLYNAYSLGLASFLAYSVKGENGQDVSGKLELNKEAFLKQLRKEDQENNQETEAIYAKLDNWLSNFNECYFIAGQETEFFKLSGEKWITPIIGDTQAIVLKNDEIIIVAFRGTQEWRDFFTDAQLVHSREFAEGFGVYNGAYEALMSVWDQVWEKIKPEQRGERTLWFTGHSLGGALATLATAQCLFEDKYKYSENPPNGLYTYGQPKAGDENFATAFDEKLKDQTFRFVNNNDMVPFFAIGPSDFDVKLPNVFKFIPKFDKSIINVIFILDYYHCGNFRLFDLEGVLQDDSFGIADKWMDRASGYIGNLLKLDPGSLNISLSLNPVVIVKSILGRAVDRFDGISDHFMAQYIINLKKNLDQWEKENPPASTTPKPNINISEDQPKDQQKEESAATDDSQQTQEPAATDDSQQNQEEISNNVLISDIFYKGQVKRVQSDEYIEITNFGSTSVDLSGWKVSSGKKEFSFPAGTELEAGSSFRVYTNQNDLKSGGFSFNSSTAIWSDKGDEGKLFDAQGNLVSNWIYDEQGNVTGNNRNTGSENQNTTNLPTSDDLSNQESNDSNEPLTF